MKQKKIYDRQTKRYLHPDNVTSLKKRDKCKGGKEHDWVLVLPKHLTFKGEPTAEKIAKYYEIKEEELKNEEKKEQATKDLGIESRYSSGLFLKRREVYKTYICSVCGKEKGY